MTREELDRLRSYLTHRIVHTERIDALYDHISRLERDARAGRELRKAYNECNGRGDHALELAMIDNAFQAYDKATKESKHE